MDKPAFDPSSTKMCLTILRGFFALMLLLVSIITCFLFNGGQAHYKTQYNFTKISWHIKTLPPDSIMTIYLRDESDSSNFGLYPKHFTLSGDYEPTVPRKIYLGDIYDQEVYTEQANIPEPLAKDNYLKYQVNQVTLLEAEPEEGEKKGRIFLKEATIIGIGDNDSTLKGSPQSIGKRITTGTDFVKNKDLLEKNFHWNFIFNKIIVLSILILIGFLGYKFRKKINMFEIGVLILMEAMFIYYIYTSSTAYLTAIS